MIYDCSTINTDPKFRELCKKPYPGHARGCPNYGKRDTCPPKVDEFFDVYDGYLYIIYTKFDLGAHVKRMRKKHPMWTDRQLRCCLYWQGTARKNLKAEIKRFKKSFSLHAVTTCPEAMGVNVTDLMKDNVGIDLEWPPIHWTYQVAIGGIRK